MSHEPSLPLRRSGLRTAAWLAVVVVLGALVQGLLVWIAPPLPLSTAALALAAASGVALFAATTAAWLIAAPAATAAASPRRILALTAATGVAAAAVAVASPYLVLLVVPIGCLLIAGAGPRGAGSLVRRHPWRVVALALATALAVVLGWVAALLFGLFVTGAPASIVTWLVAGTLGTVVIDRWSALAARA
ncbi:hypothetical protein N1031_10100 [Herbiconiux moechotypicola]|uniref:Uncharacterized protein n=1 Tax=Herbiconiux moechotypicola TaxID=637393 RepID=A0ABP5QGH8_9MICO|nr:hypothetical protein [Herbiconiux moechotypicola]MCS5730113.1 hypothetical protein [Herbiconiux moechotypicola]